MSAISIRRSRTSLHWCIGSDVPGDVWEYGHEIVPGTAAQMFPANRDGTGTNYFRSRCRRCQSSRYHHQRQDCGKKGAATHRSHREKVVKRGFAANVDEAATLMDGNGVTAGFISEILRDAFGNECPGLCCGASYDDHGAIVVVRYRITRLADLEFDWRDPRSMLTPENCGPLCASCNRQKGETPWPEFIARQRAVLLNLQRAKPGSPPPLQLTLDIL